MKDSTVLSTIFNTSLRAAVCFAIGFCTWQTNTATHGQQPELSRSQAIVAIQNESDAMRKELIRSFRQAPQFGDLIATNSKIKGSAGRLFQKRTASTVDWTKEAKEIDGLVYQLESLIEAANFSQGEQVTSQASSRLANLLSLVETVKSPEFESRSSQTIGDTGLNDREVKDFFEADFDPMEAVEPIDSSESAPGWTPSTVYKPADEFVFDEPSLPGVPTSGAPEMTVNGSTFESPSLPSLSGPMLTGPMLNGPAISQPLISQPLIMGEQPLQQPAEVSVFESPSDFQSPILGLENEVQSPLTMPNIAAPSPQQSGTDNQFLARQPQVVLRPQTPQVNPRLVAPRPYDGSAFAPRVALTPAITTQLYQPDRIHLYNVRPAYIPYGGYGGSPHGAYGGHRTGYRPYGGHGGAGNRHGHPSGNYRSPYQGGGGFSIRIGGIRF